MMMTTTIMRVLMEEEDVGVVLGDVKKAAATKKEGLVRDLVRGEKASPPLAPAPPPLSPPWAVTAAAAAAHTHTHTHTPVSPLRRRSGRHGRRR
jgi:hypothetical protein